jgi:hypothetical protein
MNLTNFFPNLAHLSHISQSGMTYERVAPCALTWFKGLARAQPVMQCHVGISRDGAPGVTYLH